MMPDQPNLINYSFDFGNDERFSFEVDIAKDPAATRAPFRSTAAAYPSWTRLEHHQCACCPLKSDTDPCCPSAVRIHQVLETFKDLRSIERVHVSVETARRTYQYESDLQSSLNSILGLQMATSGCPITSRFRSMATFHVPFSSFSETLYRSITAYLMKQYFAHIEGKEADWELVDLLKSYKELEELNRTFSQRIKQIKQSDAVVNAIIMFFAASIIAAGSIERQLSDYKDYFTGNSPYPPT